MTNPTPVLSKPVKCGWGKMYHPCSKKAIKEMESITGKWTPICSYHLKIKERRYEREVNIWSNLFPINTRPLEDNL